MPVEDPTSTVLGVARNLITELRPDRAEVPRLDLTSRLDRDLGLDSLARVELVSRVERALSVTLPEDTFSQSETIADLVTALGQASAAPKVRASAPSPLSVEPVAAAPEAAASLVHALRWHAERHPERPHVHLLEPDGELQVLTYGALLREAGQRAGALLDLGVEPREQVALMLPTGRDYLTSFFAALLAGCVPVPIYPPARPSQLEDHLTRHARILHNAQCSALVTVAEAKGAARLLRSHVPTLRAVKTPDELSAAGGRTPAPALRSDDLALLQYTSGSTGQPKGVALSHGNLLANIRAMGQAADVSAEDVMVSWLPLYHDMGLIGGWLSSLYYAMPVVLMSPLSFLARPERWLWAIHHHGGTISASPNFGYELAARKVRDEDIDGLDLGSWRFALNGAEAVSPRTLERFCERFEPYGFRASALAPVYGLAESSVGLAFPPMDRGPVIDHIERERFVRTGRAEPAVDEDHALEFVACGRPLPGHEMRVVDATGREMAERQEGRLQFRGPSCTRGYFRNPEQTARLFDGAWLESGDLAYMAGGDVYLTGRIKDLIIRAGRNIHPDEVEDVVGRIEGVRKGCVAVFASRDRASETEKLVVVAETALTDRGAREALLSDVRALATDLAGTPPDDVVLAAPHALLKTSSGKIRRAASREMYERGTLGSAGRPPWLQVLALSLGSIVPRLRRLRRASLDIGFALWAWLAFGLAVAVTWPPVLLLPRLPWRLRCAQLGARLLVRLTATPIEVTGLDNLPPDDAFILVCNHQSHLDGFVLTAALPVDFGFVAKAELKAHPLTRIPLDRLGVEYVDRFDPRESVEAARRMAAVAGAGKRLLFFPEGTHTRMAGLLPFHLGAFSIAAASGLPIVPVVIRGTRSMLRSETWFPRRGQVRVTVGAPLQPHGDDFAAAAELQRRARSWMLGRSDEPDLG